MNNTKWLCVGRGKAGWHASAVNVSSSGGDLAGYLADAAEGALVYDADAADPDAFVNHVLAGPMLNHSLAPEQDRRFTQASGPYRGFDYVGVGIFKKLLAVIPGMRLGRVEARAVVWEPSQ